MFHLLFIKYPTYVTLPFKNYVSQSNWWILVDQLVSQNIATKICLLLSYISFLNLTDSIQWD